MNGSWHNGDRGVRVGLAALVLLWGYGPESRSAGPPADREGSGTTSSTRPDSSALDALKAREERIREIEIGLRQAKRQIPRVEALVRGGAIPESDLTEACEERDFYESLLREYRDDRLAGDRERTERLARARDEVDLADAQLAMRKGLLREAEIRLERARLRTARPLNGADDRRPGGDDGDEVALKKAQVDQRRGEVREAEIRLEQSRRALTRLAPDADVPLGGPATAKASAPPGKESPAPDRPDREDSELRTAEVRPQTAPWVITLNGETAYDPDTVTKVRSRFDGLVSKVYASSGLRVRKGDPLVELHSIDLAEAKNQYAIKQAQWARDLALMKLNQPALRRGELTQLQWAEIQSSEEKSKLEYRFARDKLLLYGLSEGEIGKLEDEEGSAKAMMTLRSPVDGIVISRDVVPGNYYDKSSVLLTITPLDHLWVLASVPEIDMDKIAIGQRLTLQFPFLAQQIMAMIQYVSTDIDASSRVMKMRATIPNQNGRLRSGMRVMVLVELAPVPGHTIVSRGSLVMLGQDYWVFVNRPGVPDKYERRKVSPAFVGDDTAVIARGLSPGERFVVNPPLLNPRARRSMEREAYLQTLLEEVRAKRREEADREQQ